ncbi:MULTISPECIES: SDR family NAD(P)-dependent oxidoreductase [unclassified Roseitalea]|uniref:SDR family NAD(P)-dependent oxidoreductase n=1 Tax=unclassified Roseitalea TaxID=2639107 RepID=UPI00273D6C95|nr:MULTISPECIES: SDR family NAD(P)-dependent oxidoreductase [unclassified Roseitalea]
MTRALVTGASAGLGRAIAERLAAEGHDVTGVDRDHPGAEAPFAHIACDLADRDSVDALAARLIEDGPFDQTVLNAGISATGPFEAIPAKAHARVMAVNAEAPMVLCAALARAGALSRGGRVVFVSSLSHFTGYPGAASYAAAKDALAVYARSIRKPFARTLGVTVSAAFPGPLRTDHAARHAPAGADAEKRMAPDVAARLILAEAARGRAVIVPGARARWMALAGRIAPAAVTGAMRRIVYDKLDRAVW